LAMSLATPEKVRTLPRKLYRAAKAKAEPRMTLVSPARRMPAMKPVGKPDAGNPHVRFDERGRETGLVQRLATAPFLDSTKYGVDYRAHRTSLHR
jgi:hypothetical protein